MSEFTPHLYHNHKTMLNTIMYQDFILYSFLTYLLIHLIIDDLYLLFSNKDRTNLIKERTLVVMFNKLCDIVSQAVSGYFVCFITCWCATLKCLNNMICKYLDYLALLTQSLTTYPTCLIAGCSSIVHPLYCFTLQNKS